MSSGATVDADQLAPSALRDYLGVARVEYPDMKQTLAVLAALFLLLRPLCDVQAAGIDHDASRSDVHAVAGHDDGGVDSHGGMPCCADLEDGAVAKLTEPAAVRLASDGKISFTSAAAVFAWHPRLTADSARRPPDPVLTRTSFYARSARIRR